MNWAGIHFDEGPTTGGAYGPYVQSERLELYQHEVEASHTCRHASPLALSDCFSLPQRLVDRGDAYPCFCTPQRLDTMRKLAAKAGRDTRYDRHCLHLSPEEVRAKQAAGEPHVYRLRVPEGTTTIRDEVYGEVEVAHTQVDDPNPNPNPNPESHTPRWMIRSCSSPMGSRRTTSPRWWTTAGWRLAT